MKYTIVLDQVKMIEWDLNFSQASVFSLLHLTPSWAEANVVDGEVYYWISKSKLIDELPILTNKKDTVQRIIRALIDKGLIKRHLQNNNKTLIMLTEKGKQWNNASTVNKSLEVGDSSYGGRTDILGGVGDSSYGGEENNPTNKYTSNKNTSDKCTKNKKSAPKVAVEYVTPSYLDKDSFKEYLEIRQSLKAKNSQRAINLLINKLDEIEFNQPGDGQKALDAAILNSWKSVYPVSDTTVKTNRSKTPSNDFEAMFNEVQAELAQHNISGSSKHSGPSRGIVEGELVNDGLNDFFTRDV